MERMFLSLVLKQSPLPFHVFQRSIQILPLAKVFASDLVPDPQLKMHTRRVPHRVVVFVKKGWNVKFGAIFGGEKFQYFSVLDLLKEFHLALFATRHPLKLDLLLCRAQTRPMRP